MKLKNIIKYSVIFNYENNLKIRKRKIKLRLKVNKCKTLINIKNETYNKFI